MERYLWIYPLDWNSDLNAELRKAAILIKSLDPKSANQLLAHLNRSTAHQVVQMAQHLDGVSSREKQLVLYEFLETVHVVTASDSLTQSNVSERQGS